MSKKKKRISQPVAGPVAEPVLVVEPKSRSRRYAETAIWSVIVFWLYFYYRVHIGYGANMGEWIGAFLSNSFQVPPPHTLDYSMGFLPRTLSGQLLTFFTGGAISGLSGGAFFLALYVIAYGLLSLALGMLIEKAISAQNYLLAMFPLLLILLPRTVWVRSFSPLNYDLFMLLFTVVAFHLNRTEKLMWFAPVCVCLGIMSNYSYILLFFPLVFAVQYYEFIKSGLKRTRLFNLIATTVSAFAMESYMLWAVFHSELVSKYSFAEALAYVERKAGYRFSNIETWYFSTAVFGRHMDGRYGTLLDATTWSQYDWFDPIFYVIALLIGAPILIFTLTIWRKHMKGEKSFWKKSPYILFMLAPAIVFPAFLVFGDMDRLMSAVLITQALLPAYALIADGQNEAFMRLKEIGTRKYRWFLYVAVLLGILIPLITFRSETWLIVSAKEPVI